MKRAAPTAAAASSSAKKAVASSVTKTKIRMVEFFSGIGGMRAAVESVLLGTEEDLVSCAAFEISEKANSVYRHNFHNHEKQSTTSSSGFSVRTKLVEQLKVQDIPESNLWTMSPPCQPFTRTRMAKLLDLEDKRCAGFVAIMKMLKNIPEPNRPTWILLENVEGFAGSQAHKLFYDTLLECGYSWMDGMLSPIEMGIPNHRKRYYALCEKSDRFFARDQTSPESLPSGKDSLKDCLQLEDIPVRNLSAFVSHDIDCHDLIIPDSVFEKEWAKELPVVSHLDTHSHCFTGAYSRQLHRSTGSLLLMEPDRKDSVKNRTIDRSNMMQYCGKLRRFSIHELLKLFGFPESFSFPKDVDPNYKYKLVGNSVNVSVVKELVRHLLGR
eukprot:scaffold8471_cov184-Amphora_coffeaeformis.AAC.8